MSYLIGFMAGVLASIILMIVFDTMEAEEDEKDGL